MSEKILTRTFDRADSHTLAVYRETGGYVALERAKAMEPAAIVDEVKKSMDGSDDLTHEVVFNRLLADMRSKGVKVAEPTDPMHDSDFIRALISTYTIAPTTDWARSPAASSVGGSGG